MARAVHVQFGHDFIKACCKSGRSGSGLGFLLDAIDGATWDAFDSLQSKLEREDHFARPLDSVEKSAVRNPYRCRLILRTSQTDLDDD